MGVGNKICCIIHLGIIKETKEIRHGISFYIIYPGVYLESLFNSR